MAKYQLKWRRTWNSRLRKRCRLRPLRRLCNATGWRSLKISENIESWLAAGSCIETTAPGENVAESCEKQQNQ